MNKGFIFTFDLIFIAGLLITIFSVPVNELKKPNFDLSYFSSDKTVSYYLNKPSKGVDSNSYLCYNTIKETINSGAVIKEFCYSGYYEK